MVSMVYLATLDIRLKVLKAESSRVKAERTEPYCVARICSVLALLFEIHDPCFEKLEEEKQSYHDAYHVEEDIGDGGVTARNVFFGELHRECLQLRRPNPQSRDGASGLLCPWAVALLNQCALESTNLSIFVSLAQLKKSEELSAFHKAECEESCKG